MSLNLTQPASDRLAQLAEDAFEEEQYDLGVQCLSQMAGLGRHPTNDLLRTLMSISLCSLPKDQHPTSDSNSISHRFIIPSGPSAATIIRATGLIARIGTLASMDVVYDAILPSLSMSKEASTINRARSKRSRSNYERDFDIEDESRDSSAGPSAIPDIKTFNHQMEECENIWRVLALGDMKSRAGRKVAKPSGIARRGAIQGEREGEDAILPTNEYDREAVWRVLAMLLQGWERVMNRHQADDNMSLPSSHLLKQLQEGSALNKPTTKASFGPSTHVGEAFELILAGMAPPSLLYPIAGDRTSAKKRFAERMERSRTASMLLVQLFQLVHLGHLDRQAVLRGTATVLEKGDGAAKVMLCSILRQEGFSFELTEAILICLELTAQEGEDVPGNTEYQQCIKKIKRSSSLSEKASSFLGSIEDQSWLCATPGEGLESAMVVLLDDRDGSEISSLARQGTIKTLLIEDWTIESTSKNASRSKATKASLTWDQLSFAAAWRRATMQIIKDRFQLKREVITTLDSLQDDMTKEGAALKALQQMSSLCMATLIKAGQKDTLMMQKCCDKMEKTFEQVKANHNEDDEDDNEIAKWQRSFRRHLSACSSYCLSIEEEVNVLERWRDINSSQTSIHQP